MSRAHMILVPMLLAAAAVSAQNYEIPDWENSVRFELIVSQDRVRPGDDFELALLADIQDGYHLYGPEEQEPSRTKVSVEGADLTAGEPAYPPVVRRELSGLGEYDLYEGHIAIRIPVTLAKTTKPGSHEARLVVDYQICTDYACSAPTSDELVLDLETAESGAKVKPLYPEVFTKE